MTNRLNGRLSMDIVIEFLVLIPLLAHQIVPNSIQQQAMNPTNVPSKSKRKPLQVIVIFYAYLIVMR